MMASSPLLKARADSDGCNININCALKRAVSYDARLPSHCDNGYSIHCSLSISTSEDSFHSIMSDDNNNFLSKQRHNSFTLSSKADRPYTRAQSDSSAYNSLKLKPLQTVASGTALADLADRQNSDPRREHKPSGDSHGHGPLPPLPPRPDSSTDEVDRSDKTHRANMSCSSHYSADAGKHGFLTYHTPANSSDSLVFPCLLEPKQAPSEIVLSPRCLLPYQERKRLTLMESDEGREEREDKADGLFLELDEEAQGRTDETQQQRQQAEEFVEKSARGAGDEGKVEIGVGPGEVETVEGRESGANSDEGAPIPSEQESHPKEDEAAPLLGQANSGTSNGHDQPPSAPSPDGGRVGQAYVKKRTSGKRRKLGKMLSKMRRFRVNWPGNK